MTRKYCIFLMLCLILAVLTGSRTAAAYETVFIDAGSIDFSCEGRTDGSDTIYYFKFMSNGVSCSDAKTVYYVDSSGEYVYVGSLETSIYETDSNGAVTQIYAEGEYTLANDLDIVDFVCKVGVQYQSVAFTTYYLEAHYGEDVAPTATPSPTPTPAPTVTVKVSIDGKESVSTYFTGGCDSVSSYFELQYYPNGPDDSDGIYDTVDRVTFVDGAGTYEYTLSSGSWYRALVSYTYLDSSGTRQTKKAYSDYFQADTETAVTPEPTLEPTATSTPKPTPTSAPVVTLDVSLDGLESDFDYYTGGCDSVSSYFEIRYFVNGSDDPDGIYDTVDRVTFVDGKGSYSYILSNGEDYQAVVSYTYLDTSGTKQTKVVYSEFFQAGGAPVGSNPKVIWNLKSLMAWVWNDLMEIPITYEGFTVTFKQIFLFSMVAPTIILFVIYLLGMHSIGFLFGHHWSISDKDDTVSYSERDVIGSTARIEETWTQGDSFIMRDKKE